MNKADHDDETAANTFLFVIGGVFAASIAAVILCGSEKISTEPIHFVNSSASEIFLSKLFCFYFILNLFTSAYTKTILNAS